MLDSNIQFRVLGGAPLLPSNRKDKRDESSNSAIETRVIKGQDSGFDCGSTVVPLLVATSAGKLEGLSQVPQPVPTRASAAAEFPSAPDPPALSPSPSPGEAAKTPGGVVAKSGCIMDGSRKGRPGDIGRYEKSYAVAGSMSESVSKIEESYELKNG